MAWKQRGRKKYLYLVSRDAEGRVRTRYAGAGPRAEALSRVLEARKAARLQEAQECAAEGQAVTEISALSEKLGEELSLLVSGVLVASGFYSHKRQWRRRGRKYARIL